MDNILIIFLGKQENATASQMFLITASKAAEKMSMRPETKRGVEYVYGRNVMDSVVTKTSEQFELF